MISLKTRRTKLLIVSALEQAAYYFITTQDWAGAKYRVDIFDDQITLTITHIDIHIWYYRTPELLGSMTPMNIQYSKGKQSAKFVGSTDADQMLNSSIAKLIPYKP